MLQNGSIGFGILRHIILKLALTIAIVAILVLIERAFPRLNTAFHWELITEAESGFLGALAQVAATMLGLYFAAVSLVASTAYARVPGDVRAMVVEEQVGDFYFRFLAQFAATAVVMLSAVSLGIPLGVLNVLWVSFLGVFGVFSFVVLGRRTFSFFDPAALVQYLNHRLARAMAEVTPDGYKWFDPSFQQHHQRQADRALDAYANLVAIAEQTENLNSRALVELAEGLISALNHYASIKGRVPTKSLWFRQRPKYKQWLLASYHELEVARATDTTLQPEMVPDLHWFETDVCRVLARIGRQLSARADLTGMVAVLNAGQKYARTASALGSVEEVLQLVQTLGRQIDEAFAEAKFDGTSDDTVAQSLNRIAAVDLHALGLMNVLLGIAHALESTSRAAFEQQIDQIEWNKPASLYTGHFPREVLQQCEEMQERMVFEREVEGNVIMPDWLQREIAALGYARFLATVVERMLTDFETRFVHLLEQRVKAEDLIGAASLIYRGLEATNKLDSHLARIHAWWDALLELNRSRDWEWPTIDWADASKRSLALRDRLVKCLADCIGPLMDLPGQKGVPDLFGQAYSVLADSCFDSLIRGDEAMFTAIFRAYFLTAITAQHKVRDALGKVTSLNVSATLGSLSDLLAISGFAELYSALTAKTFSAVSRGIWDSYLASLKDDASRKKAIDLLIRTREPFLGMSSRDMLRFRWERATRSHLVAQGIAMDDFGFGPRRRGSLRHPSPLVRVFAARGNNLSDAEDIFFAVYLLRQPDAVGLKVPHEIESYQQALAREEAHKEDGDDTP